MRDEEKTKEELQSYKGAIESFESVFKEIRSEYE